MKWWTILWQALRDVVLTSTGIWCIVSQVLSRNPDGLILGTGLALTVPSVAEHVRALLPSGGPASSSSSREAPTSSPSSPSHPEEHAGE